MIGQWIGHIPEGTNKGFCLMNLEIRTPGVGQIMFFEANPNLYSMWATLHYQIDGDKIYGKLSEFLVFDGVVLILSQELNKRNIDIRYPVSGEVNGRIENGKIFGHFKTDIGTSGDFVLETNDNLPPSKADKITKWEKFKKYIETGDSENTEKIYRGHTSRSYRLITSFHRTGRTNILRYVNEDIPILSRNINAISAYKYNLREPDGLEELACLAQHHGYPTPLLDWTESPYIAAYFAFQKDVKNKQRKFARIYIFYSQRWMEFWGLVFPIANHISAPKPIVSVKRLPVINNNRALPQQSVFTFSSLVDMESFIMACEKPNRRFLIKIDLPYSEKDKAMKDLYKMGITAGSLFPGIDGVCKTLKEKWF